jgi:hypothetical protein
MVARETAAVADPFFAPPQPDDGLLHALLSFSLLTERQPTVAFLRDLLPALDREPATDLLVRLLHGAETRTDQSYADYRPGRSSLTSRHAYYTANLVILASLTADGITADRLFPGDRRPVHSWPHLTSLWYARLSGKAFESLVRHFQVERIVRQGNRTLIVRYIGHAGYRRVGGFEPGWDEEGTLPSPHTLDMVHFLGDPELDGLALAAEPAIMAADLRSAAQVFSHSEEAVEHLANAWRLTKGMRETIEAIIADLRDEYRNDPERVAAAFRRATGAELPDAVVEPDRSEGAHPGRNDATGRG